MSPPFLSVVMPVYNGARFLERAVASARAQTFADWELVAADDGSTDDSMAVLQRVAAEEPRLRVICRPANGGVSAARNTALREARGEWVAYLDCDDEFYPEHFRRVFDSRQRGDVLVFAYDILEERPELPQTGRVVTWDPRDVADRLMLQHIAVPLGVAHRRQLLEHTGLFDESLRRDEDSELWRRFARAGAAFHFLPQKSGLYHVRADSLSRTTASASQTAPAAGLTALVELEQGDRRHRLLVPARELEVVRDVLERHVYGGVPRALLRRPPVVLDVGANVGAFAAYACLRYPGAVVHCFEPFGPTLELLRQNTAGFANVRVHPFALADRDGEGSLHLHAELSVCHSLVLGMVPSPAATIRVAVRDAGGVWDELGLQEVDVLKLDVEGSEVTVLQSLGQRLARVRFVLAEFHSRQDRRRIGELLVGFGLIGEHLYREDLGVVKYARDDLRRQRATPRIQNAAPHRAEKSVEPAPALPKATGNPRLLFCSPHNYLDPSSGAALATRDLLEMLTARGWSCGVLCGARTDFESGADVSQLLQRCGVTAEVRRGEGFRLHHFMQQGVPVTIHEPEPAAPAGSFLAAFERVAQLFRPDLLLTYGGDALSQQVVRHAKRLGLRVVFCLLNDAYTSRDFFRPFDAVLVHSEFARGFYRQRLGVESTALPCPLPWGRVLCQRAEPRFLTFVNPQPVKGVALFARLALELGRRRPDVPLLVVEGRGTAGWLARCGVDLSGLSNLHAMPNTADPRDFYSVSRAVLVPSLWQEMFGRVAAEAMINGIPVLASRRGGLPQTVGDAGLLFDVPDRYDGRSLLTPTAAEVAPWLAAVERLWDDSAFYQDRHLRCLEAARQWHPDQIGPRYETFFRDVAADEAAKPL